jgi:hypothetical protein
MQKHILKGSGQELELSSTRLAAGRDPEEAAPLLVSLRGADDKLDRPFHGMEANILFPFHGLKSNVQFELVITLDSLSPNSLQ